MRKKLIYLAGKFTETEKSIKVVNPYDGTLVAECCTASVAHLDKAIEAGLKVKSELRELSSRTRYTILKTISDELFKRKQELADLLSRESAKPLRYALGEVERASDTFLFAAEESKRLPKEYLSLDQTLAGKGREGLVKYFPVGLIAGISPFNFPLNLVAHKIAPAIAAGCPIILKPSSLTPLSALALAEIIDKTELPKGAVSILPCDRETGDKLVKDERINLCSFTGSPEVGWKIKADSGKKKVILELGGNAAVYIHRDAELEHAIARCMVGAFAYSGQVCIHAQRIYVHAEIYDEFLQHMKEKAGALKNGNPIESDTAVSVMIDEKNALRIEDWVNDGVNKGAKLICGGKREKNYYSPTILSDTTNHLRVNAEEVFGPVVCIEKVSSMEEGLEQINATRFGLQAGLFTNDFKVIQQAFNSLEVGGIIVNDVPTFRVDNMPYGGIKDSGLGREGVAYTIREYMEPRLLVY